MVSDDDTMHQVGSFLGKLEPPHGRTYPLLDSVGGFHGLGIARPTDTIHVFGIHIDSVRRLTSRDPSPTVVRIERENFRYISHELGVIVREIVAGSSHHLGMVHARLRVDYQHANELRDLSTKLVTRKVLEHYASRAKSGLDHLKSQIHHWGKWWHRDKQKAQPIPSCDDALDALVPALVALQVEESGVFPCDLVHPAKLAPIGTAELAELLALRASDTGDLPSEEFAAKSVRWAQKTIDVLQTVIGSSPLPTDPPTNTLREIDEWLFSVRMCHSV